MVIGQVLVRLVVLVVREAVLVKVVQSEAVVLVQAEKEMQVVILA